MMYEHLARILWQFQFEHLEVQFSVNCLHLHTGLPSKIGMLGFYISEENVGQKGRSRRINGVLLQGTHRRNSCIISRDNGGALPDNGEKQLQLKGKLTDSQGLPLSVFYIALFQFSEFHLFLINVLFYKTVICLTLQFKNHQDQIPRLIFICQLFCCKR